MNQLLIRIVVSLRTKKTLLENAVASVKHLCAVRDQSEQHFTDSGKMINYDQQATSLLSAGNGYDSQFASTSSKSSRKVYHAELGGSDFEIDSPSEVKQDLDCDVGASTTILLVNMTNRGNYYD